MQGELSVQLEEKHHDSTKVTGKTRIDQRSRMQSSEADSITDGFIKNEVKDGQIEDIEFMAESNGNSFLKRYSAKSDGLTNAIVAFAGFVYRY